MNVQLERIDDLGGQLKTFWFRPERPLQYTAGQFTELYLPHTGADTRGQKRWFTLTSSPTEELLAITTKFSPTGSSFKRTLEMLSPGDVVTMAEPMGDFVLPKTISQPLVFVAAGIGITPVRSMIQWLYDRHEKRPIQLIYAASSPEELVFQQLFESYPLRSFTPIATRPDNHIEWNGERGSLTTERVVELVGEPAESARKLIYLSGPEILVETLTKELPSHGIPSQHIVTDYFHGYPGL